MSCTRRPLAGAGGDERDGACAAADVEHPAIRGVPHHHPCRVAGQPAGRFRGNVGAGDPPHGSQVCHERGTMDFARLSRRRCTILTLFSLLIGVQFVVVAVHDLVDIPGWTHGAQVQVLLGRRKLWLVTAINSLFPGLAVAFAIHLWNRPKPLWVVDYWVLYCSVTVASAIAMWYIPYCRGTTEGRKREYSEMYAGTRHVLPPRGDNPRPIFSISASTSSS